MQKKLSVLNQKEDEFRREENRLQETILSKEQKAAKIKPSREELHGLEQGHILEESYREKRGLYEEARQETQELRRLLEAEQSELSCLTGQLTSIHDTARRYLTIQQEQLAELSVQLAAFTKAKVSVQKDTEELQNRHMALTLRSRLKDGDICPVCGGIHHKDHGMHPDKVIAESSPDTAELSDDASVLLQLQHLQSKAEELTRQEKELEDSRRKTEEQDPPPLPGIWKRSIIFFRSYPLLLILIIPPLLPELMTAVPLILLRFPLPVILTPTLSVWNFRISPHSFLPAANGLCSEKNNMTAC